MEFATITPIQPETFNHVCEIDCYIVETGYGTVHMFYPADPTVDAGRYEFDRQKEKPYTRREYRRVYGFSNKACRVWEKARRDRIASIEADIAFANRKED